MSNLIINITCAILSLIGTLGGYYYWFDTEKAKYWIIGASFNVLTVIFLSIIYLGGQ